MAARPNILFGIAAAAAGQKSAPAALALATSFLVLFLLVLKLLFKSFQLLNGVVILFVTPGAPTLAAISTVLT